MAASEFEKSHAVRQAQTKDGMRRPGHGLDNGVHPVTRTGNRPGVVDVQRLLLAERMSEVNRAISGPSIAMCACILVKHVVPPEAAILAIPAIFDGDDRP